MIALLAEEIILFNVQVFLFLFFTEQNTMHILKRQHNKH